MKTRLLLFFACIAIGASLLTGCLPGGSGDPAEDPAENPVAGGYAPASLSVNYLFVRSFTSSGLTRSWIRIMSASQARSSESIDENQYFINTPYSYSKTGANTATFTFTTQQYINWPIRNRRFLFTGTLTFTSKKDCTYAYTRQYYADGALSGTTSGKENWVYDAVENFR
jgi:hypothetical protein